jgi:hypothetical protein
MPSMWWWSATEDGRAAGGWQCDGSSPVASREVMVVPRVRKYSIWVRPALMVKCYEDGRITMSEGEWRL